MGWWGGEGGEGNGCGRGGCGNSGCSGGGCGSDCDSDGDGGVVMSFLYIISLIRVV